MVAARAPTCRAAVAVARLNENLRLHVLIRSLVRRLSSPWASGTLPPIPPVNPRDDADGVTCRRVPTPRRIFRGALLKNHRSPREWLLHLIAAWCPRVVSVAVFIACGVQATSLADPPQIVPTDLQVTGTITIQPAADVPILELRGPANGIGLQGTPTATLSYHDNVQGVVVSKVHRHGAEWQWQVANADGAERLVMRLTSSSNGSALTLIDPENPNSVIVIDPAGGMTIGNQPVLTRTVADAVYLRTDSEQGGLFGGRATALRSIAVGPSQSVALGATTIGHGNLASAHCATALGTVTWAAGPWSTTFGVYSLASGGCATAMGNGTRGEGAASLATGMQTVARGDYSSAFGLQTVAQGFAQFVVGQHNVAQGDARNWIETDDLFVVGNGTSAEAPANALVVKKNGDTTIAGSLRVTGVMHVEPRGGISMGEFTAAAEE